MAEDAVGFLITYLKHILSHITEPLGDSKGQIVALLNDLIPLKAFLKETSGKLSKNNSVQELENDIRSLVENAEDVIDTLLVKIAYSKTRSSILKAFRATEHSAKIRQLTKEIESIRKEVTQIYQLKQFGFQALQLEESQDRGQRLEKTRPLVEEANVIGFDEVAETLIKRLNGEDLDLDIITIIGMPGLGKTTLARKIYNDPVIEYEFFMRAWVYVSQKYSRREVFLSIFTSITQQTIEYMDNSDEVLVKQLRDILEKGKYLIVLDDVWTGEAWRDLSNAFPNNKKGSRILITGRNTEVSLSANPLNGTHYLKFLTMSEGWELLENKVFGKKKCPAGELQILGEHIAAKCEGLPLAIVVIAGILLNNRDSSDWWKKVAENVSSFIVRDERNFMEVIAMSYNHLPYHLKSCFLYLGIFPEAYEISVWRLINIWIAEGFIEQNGVLSLEGIAEACVEDLVNRNLLIVAKRKANGQIKTCRVVSLLYDFCRKEAARQNFYKEITRHNEGEPEYYRRVGVHSNVMEYMYSKPSGPRVRSFLCYTHAEITLPRELIPTIPKAFELLRVLDIQSIIFFLFPKDLLQLVLLRYLAISCYVKSLPSGISNLWNMQTLIFLTTSSTLQLKEEIWKLYQLRHLCTNASAILPRPPSTTLNVNKSVQSLSMISAESCTEHVFARTPYITKLGVRGNLVVLFNSMFENVGKLEFLTNLKLYNDLLPSEGKRLSLPPSYKFPTMLSKLTLSNTSLDWEQMQVLGSLEKLEVLKLKDNAFKGELWAPKEGGFLSLKLFHIHRTDLIIWKASQHHFPSLKHLILQHCENLEEIPVGFAEIRSFQILELYRTNPRAAPSAHRIQQRRTSGVFKLSIYPPVM